MDKQRSVEERSTSGNVEFSSREDDFFKLEKFFGEIQQMKIKVMIMIVQIVSYFPKKKRVIPIADSESDNKLKNIENANGDSGESSEWENVTERDSSFQQVKFSVYPKVIGPQISPNIIDPIDIFKLFFTDELVDNIMKETNNYANTKIFAEIGKAINLE